jgi:hypothetical protein
MSLEPQFLFGSRHPFGVDCWITCLPVQVGQQKILGVVHPGSFQEKGQPLLVGSNTNSVFVSFTRFLIALFSSLQASTQAGITGR